MYLPFNSGLNSDIWKQKLEIMFFVSEGGKFYRAKCKIGEKFQKTSLTSMAGAWIASQVSLLGPPLNVEMTLFTLGHGRIRQNFASSKLSIARSCVDKVVAIRLAVNARYYLVICSAWLTNGQCFWVVAGFVFLDNSFGFLAVHNSHSHFVVSCIHIRNRSWYFILFQNYSLSGPESFYLRNDDAGQRHVRKIIFIIARALLTHFFLETKTKWTVLTYKQPALVWEMTKTRENRIVNSKELGPIVTQAP